MKFFSASWVKSGGVDEENEDESTCCILKERNLFLVHLPNLFLPSQVIDVPFKNSFLSFSIIRDVLLF